MSFQQLPKYFEVKWAEFTYYFLLGIQKNWCYLVIYFENKNNDVKLKKLKILSNEVIEYSINYFNTYLDSSEWFPLKVLKKLAVRASHRFKLTPIDSPSRLGAPLMSADHSMIGNTVSAAHISRWAVAIQHATPAPSSFHDWSRLHT